MRMDELAQALVERFYPEPDFDHVGYEQIPYPGLPDDRLIPLTKKIVEKDSSLVEEAAMINAWSPYEQIMFCLQHGISKDEIMKVLY